MIDAILAGLVRLSPRETAPADLAAALSFLEWETDAVTLSRLADGTGGVGVVATVLVALWGGVVVALGLGVLVSGAVATLRGGPLLLATARRARALGGAPGIVGRAALRLRVAPTPEGAAAFAATGRGVLAEDLAAHVRRARGTPRSGLGAFGEAWREEFPALYRAALLVEAAAEPPPTDRNRTLDRAMETVLDGTRDRAAAAADALQGPATGLYAFGVLLPLALVGVLPAAGVAGVEATLPLVVLVYDVFLPVALLCASAWLLSRRPVAFPPAAVGRDHPDVVDRRWPQLVALGGAGATAGLISGWLLETWAVPVAAIGVGVGAALAVRYRSVVAVHRRIAAFEAALPDALYLVGRRVADGVAVEHAIDVAADELEAPADEVFAAASRRQRQLNVGLEEAFCGEYGALGRVPSPRAESAAALLDLAAREGPPAGRAIVETADHLDELRAVERDCRRELGRVTSTLGNTAALFAPLVGGATVALADGVGTTTALEGGAPPTAGLGLAVGAYVLLLAVLLTVLSAGLARGFDRATIGYRVGVALCCATPTYLLAFHSAGALTGGL